VLKEIWAEKSMSEHSALETKRSSGMTRQERMIVALTGCSHALSHGYLLIFPAVLLLLKEEFSMGYLGLGVIGNIMTFSYGLGALPGGMIYNRFGPRRLYLFCFLGSAVVSLLIGASPGLILFTAGLSVLGALGSVYHPLANSLITSKVKKYGIALGIHGAAGNVGLAAAPILAAMIGSWLGWRYAYLLFAIPGIALAVWSIFIDMEVREIKKEDRPVEPAAQLSPPISRWAYFSIPLIVIYLMNMLHSFAYHGAILFLPAYMAKNISFQIFSWDSVAVGGMFSGIVLCIGVFGQYFGGSLGQKPGLERSVLILSAAGLPFILAMAFTRDFFLIGASLVFFFFNFALQPATNVLLAQRTTVPMRGTAFGIYFFAAFGLGSVASSFSGYIAQRFGLSWVFVGLSCTTVMLIAVAYALLRIKKRETMDPQISQITQR
jgi:MFS family permease